MQAKLFDLLKFLKILTRLKDVSTEYQTRTGENKPGWVSQRFAGSVSGIIGALAMYFGATIDTGVSNDINTHLEIALNGAWQIYEILKTMWPSALILWGAALGIKGAINAQQRKKEEPK